MSKEGSDSLLARSGEGASDLGVCVSVSMLAADSCMRGVQESSGFRISALSARLQLMHSLAAP